MRIVVKGMFLMDLGEKIFNELCSLCRVPTEMQQVYWGKYSCFKMSCILKDALGVTETVSFPTITVNWSSPNFCWVKLIWLF